MVSEAFQDDEFDENSLDKMFGSAQSAANFLKVFANEGRLMILCHLVTGEKSVTELEELLSSRQAAVSQQLSRMRFEGVVGFRREGKSIFYSIKDDKARALIKLLYEQFCS
ncbi:MAG: helix-turn-helix transcriptional regulator [Hyphomicrobiales bacterium]|nr:helix-turn-helix transcriptional regulator [Hyphomicrobiales bacterium]MCP4998784.1 helix-turn-helix transcriptional regulator [Hyphomicrobiales bacterium]